MAEPKFLLDCMLGKVARWLTMLGYDAKFVKKSDRSDLDIADEALREDRILVTRDTKIPEIKGLKKLVLREQSFEDQLKRVLSETGLRPERTRLFSRCTECNQPLSRISREEALPRIPTLVRSLSTDFFQCPECKQIFWTGTHVENTVKKLNKMGLCL